MRIFVAGATGAIGRRLVPRLTQAGHEVIGMSRSADRAAGLRGAGAEAVLADALDAGAVRRAVLEARPEVVVQQLTDLKSLDDPRRFEQQFAGTNRLRTEGNDNLLAAARAAGARRYVAQSYAGWPFARTGGPVKTEDDPLDDQPPPALRPALAAIRHLEDAVTAFPGGVVLRYGTFYGPGTAFSEGSPQLEAVRRRRFPLVGDAQGVWSFIHVDDAAAATVAAIESDATGIFNIVDDEPAPVAEWLPELAAAIGAPRPRRLPAWLVRLAAGAHTVSMLTDIRGASNARAREVLRWDPQHRSWREGFRTAL